MKKVQVDRDRFDFMQKQILTLHEFAVKSDAKEGEVVEIVCDSDKMKAKVVRLMDEGYVGITLIGE